MSDGLNRVLLLGNLAADPELRHTQGGQAVLNIRLATNESYLDKDKVRRERTDYHNITVWGKRGEGLAKILSKGSSIFVEGSLRTSSYDDRDGNKRYKTEIIANNVILTGGGGRSRGGPQGAPDDDYGPTAAGENTGKRPPRNSPPSEDDGSGGHGGGGSGGDDDIPFVFIGAAPEREGIPKHWL